LRPIHQSVLSSGKYGTYVVDVVNHKTGNVLIVPHSSVKQSLASALSGGSVTANEGLHHYPLVKFEDEWKLNVNEVNMNNVSKTENIVHVCMIFCHLEVFFFMILIGKRKKN
jgi:hypothetical protein